MGSADSPIPEAPQSGRTDGAASEPERGALSAVAEAVARLRYGAVHLTIHDGRVVQLDVTERRRFTI